MATVDWLDGAVAATEAIKPLVEADGTVGWREVLLAWLQRTKPNESAIGRALRDQRIWRDVGPTIRGQLTSRSGIFFYGWLHEIETTAEKDHARRVGERHILAVVPDRELQYFGVDPSALRDAVRLMEVGADFPRNEIDGRWHGLVDANIIVQYHQLDQINWLEEVGADAVTLWVTNSLLNELDGMKFYSDSPRVRDRARRFSTWLSDHLGQGLQSAGAPIRQGVALRVWAPASASGARDTDHLEAAFALLERGVPVAIVTADTGLEARARVAGVAVRKLQDRWQLPPEPTPKEKETALRLKRAQLEESPVLTLTADFVPGEAIALSIHNDPAGGEARDVVIFFRARGVPGADVWDRTGNGHLVFDEQNGYRAPLPGTLPPGSTDRVALMMRRVIPDSIEYEIRASHEVPRLGRLVFQGGHYVEAEKAQ